MRTRAISPFRLPYLFVLLFFSIILAAGVNGNAGVAPPPSTYENVEAGITIGAIIRNFLGAFLVFAFIGIMFPAILVGLRSISAGTMFLVGSNRADRLLPASRALACGARAVLFSSVVIAAIAFTTMVTKIGIGMDDYDRYHAIRGWATWNGVIALLVRILFYDRAAADLKAASPQNAVNH